jgi:protein required for attachment to host cells
MGNLSFDLTADIQYENQLQLVDSKELRLLDKLYPKTATTTAATSKKIRNNNNSSSNNSSSSSKNNNSNSNNSNNNSYHNIRKSNINKKLKTVSLTTAEPLANPLAIAEEQARYRLLLAELRGDTVTLAKQLILQKEKNLFVTNKLVTATMNKNSSR